MPHRLDALKSSVTHHGPLEDAQGIFTGVVLAALALSIFAHLGLITGGMAGLALIISYGVGTPIGLTFFLLNLPFYILAFKRMGWGFTLKTFVSVAGLSLLVDLQPQLFAFGKINPLYGAILGGLVLGFALLAMFRHRASLGGVGILAFYLQDTFGWRAGLVQLSIDVAILGLSFLVIDWELALLSVVGAVVLNLFLTINHRQGRYVAR